MDLARLSARRWPRLAAPGLLALAVLLPNLNGLSGFFVSDDYELLARAARYPHAWSAVSWTFFNEWEPLWYLDFYRDFRLWGLEPAGYKVAGLAWLWLGVLSLYHLVRRLWPQAGLAPWAAALLFATHPLHDEVVNYMAARGHIMASALMTAALCLYARARADGMARPRARGLVAALVAAFLAAVSKETALVLPLAVAVLEAGAPAPRRSLGQRLRDTARAGSMFLIPVALYFVAMELIVGFDEAGSRFAGIDAGAALEAARDLGAYTLLGGAPFPFGSLDEEGIERWAPLGWVLFVVLAVIAVVLYVRRAAWPGTRTFALGLALSAIHLGPVFAADLPIRRRYVFGASLGLALVVAVGFEALAGKLRRVAVVLLLVLVGAGTVARVERNDLYRQAGEVGRSFIETVRAAPLDRAPGRETATRRIAIVTMPRFWGGDGLSGAYVLHRTDVRSALRLGGLDPYDRPEIGLECDYADDYTAVAEPRGADRWTVTVSFRMERAFDAARQGEPDDNDAIRVTVLAEDRNARTLTYEIAPAEEFHEPPGTELYLYSAGRFTRLDAE